MALLLVGGPAPAAEGQGIAYAGLDDAPMFVASERSAALLDAGRREIIAFRLGRAEALFAELADRPDGQIAGAFYLETIALLQFIMTDKEVYREAFFARSDALRRRLNRAPDSVWRTFIEAEANLHRAAVRAKRGQYTRAVLAGRSAYRGYTRVVKDRPDFYEAYKGLGIFHLAVGSVPGTYQTLLKLFGFRGDVDRGLRELELAATRSGFNREEANVYLAMIDLKLFDASGDGGERLAALFHANQQSPLIGYIYGEYLHVTRQAAEAERVYRAAAATYGDGEHFYIDYVDPLLGDVLFRQNRFDEAAFYYRRYLAQHEGPAMKATTTLSLGLALELQGRRAEAVTYYQQVNATRDFDSDAVSQRRAERLLRAPLNARERQLLLGQNAFDAGRYDDALTILHAVEADPEATRDEQAEAAYRRGRVFHVQHRPEEALQAYATAVAWHHDPASRWGPWAQYYAGLLHEAGDDTASARAALEAALAYEGTYDYHQALHRSAKIALKRVKKAG